MKKIREILKDLTEEYKKAVAEGNIDVCRSLESEIAIYTSMLDELDEE